MGTPWLGERAKMDSYIKSEQFEGTSSNRARGVAHPRRAFGSLSLPLIEVPLYSPPRSVSCGYVEESASPRRQFDASLVCQGSSAISIWRKYERDIDVLLAEEFTVSTSFAAWFRQQVGAFADGEAQVVDVVVSKSDNLGESDLVVVYQKAAAGQRFAVFIEDKIDAPLQPEQAARYRQRAQVGVRKGHFAEFQVVLCSPAAYRDVHPDAGLFDAFVSFEDIAGYFQSQNPDDPRAVYRADLLSTCASRRINHWERQDDPLTNAFWQAAYRVASREFPELEMKARTFTKNQTWIDFRPTGMPSRPIRVAVSLKGGWGVVDLTFSGILSRSFSPLVMPLLEENMTAHQTGKSAAIRLEVESFTVSQVDDSALLRLRKAFEACVHLTRFYYSHRKELDDAALNSLPQPE
jgi:hypothetical protein